MRWICVLNSVLWKALILSPSKLDSWRVQFCSYIIKFNLFFSAYRICKTINFLLTLYNLIYMTEDS